MNFVLWHLGQNVGVSLCVVLEKVPPTGVNFKPRQQNSVLVPLRGSFQNFLRANSFFYGSIPLSVIFEPWMVSLILITP